MLNELRGDDGTATAAESGGEPAPDSSKEDAAVAKEIEEAAEAPVPDAAKAEAA